MSQDNQGQLKQLLLDYAESVREVTLLRDKVSRIGETYTAAGRDLENDPSAYLDQKYALTSQETLEGLVRALQVTEERTEQLKRKAIRLGAPL